MRALRFGIIGAGGVGQSHADAAQKIEGVELCAAAEVDEAKSAAFGEKYGARMYSDYQEMLAREPLDLVCVALPTWLHCEATVRSAEAGAHVLVEKPMAMTLDECDRMIEAARKNRRQLMVGHTFHFHPGPAAAKEILDSGVLGRLVLATDTIIAPRRPAQLSVPSWYWARSQGGGMLMINGVHSIDRTMWFVGSPVVAVKAMVGRFMHEIAADDTEMMMLHFANGVYAMVLLSGLDKGINKSEAEFVCTRGMLKYGHSEVWVCHHESYEKAEVPQENGFVRQLRAFVGAIRERAEPPVPGEWGREVMRVLLAAEESSRTGHEIRLQED